MVADGLEAAKKSLEVGRLEEPIPLTARCEGKGTTFDMDAFASMLGIGAKP